MPSNLPLANAIRLLIEASARSNANWTTFFSVLEGEIEKWCNGEDYPSDRQMTFLIRELERTQGSKGNPGLPAAIDHFWLMVRGCEKDPNSFTELLREPGESVAQRLTRFTNAGWLKNISQTICLIPPERRREYIEAHIRLFNTFVEPGV